MNKCLSEREIGDEIGDYVISRVLSRNVLGSTYLCQHAVTGKKVIIKTYPKEVPEEAGFMARYQLIYEQIATIKHPNILPTRKMDLDHEEPYAVLDYLPSVKGIIPLSLKDILHEQGVLSELQVYYLARQLMSVLSYAHTSHAGMVHYNLKPSNILFSSEGQIRLAEFGILNLIGQSVWKKILSEHVQKKQNLDQKTSQYWGHFNLNPDLASQSDEKRRSVGALSETLLYMSPEQYANDRVTPQSNIYSLGMILYKALTGHTFHQGAPPPSHYGVSQYWDTVIAKSTAQNPNNRYSSISAMSVDINRSHKLVALSLYFLFMVVVAGGLFLLGWGLPQLVFNQNSKIEAFKISQTSFENSLGWLDAHTNPLHPSNSTYLSSEKNAILPVIPLGTSIEMVPMPSLYRDFDGDSVYYKYASPYASHTWISRTEISQRDYLSIMGNDPSFYRDLNASYPVTMVSYEDAMRFCKILTDSQIALGGMSSDYEYTLPTRMEWTSAYLASYSVAQLPYVINRCGRPTIKSRGIIRSVSDCNANSLGLFDMYDNVSEWVKPFAFTDSQTTQAWVLGRSFLNQKEFQRQYDKQHVAEDIGFRIVLKQRDLHE